MPNQNKKTSKTKASEPQDGTKNPESLTHSAKSVKKPKSTSNKSTISPQAAKKASAAKKTKTKTEKAAPKASAVKGEKRKELKPTKQKSDVEKSAPKAKPNKASSAKSKAAGQAEGAKQNKAAESATTKSEVAKKLIESKAAKKKESPAAKTKAKPARPTFTLDEALEIAKSKSTENSGKPGNGDKPATPKAAPADNAKKEVPDDVKQENRVLGAASVNDILGYNPNAGPKKTEESEIPAKFSRYYKLLVELREHVISGLDIHTRDTLKRSSKEDSGDLSAYSQHMADAGTDTFDRDFALSLVSSEQDALYEIEDAIRRIKKGTYGICEITGKPIKKERLLAVPFAKFSVEGQAEYERTNRKSAYRGGAFGDATGEDAVQFMDEDSDDN